MSPEHADVTAVHQAGVDGFVVYSVREDDPHFLAVLERPLPTVVCDQPTGVEGVDRVGVDDRAGMLALTRHLTGAGPPAVRGAVHAAGRGPPRRARRPPNGRRRPPTRCSATGWPGLRDGLAEVGVDWADVPVLRALRPQRGRGRGRRRRSCSPRTPT